MSVPIGFLVVRSVELASRHADRSLRSAYHGVDRVPPWPADDESERDAIEQYVFGDYKDDATNLIPSFDAAAKLQRLLSSSERSYDILFCCEDPQGVRNITQRGVDIEHLGYDVAGISGDYWSIVADLSRNDWASRFRKSLNEFGLFSRKADAEAYLREYRDRREPDSDSPFDVVYVVRVLPGEKRRDGMPPLPPTPTPSATA
jgi:hypothetical protein